MNYLFIFSASKMCVPIRAVSVRVNARIAVASLGPYNVAAAAHQQAMVVVETRASSEQSVNGAWM
jgi:hypothetical protein